MDAEQLAFKEHSFDCVVSTLSTCTVLDPVCKHCEKWPESVADRRAEAHAQLLGCHLSREPLDLVRLAGLGISRGDRRFLRVFHTIEVQP